MDAEYVVISNLGIFYNGIFVHLLCFTFKKTFIACLSDALFSLLFMQIVT